MLFWSIFLGQHSSDYSWAYLLLYLGIYVFLIYKLNKCFPPVLSVTLPSHLWSLFTIDHVSSLKRRQYVRFLFLICNIWVCFYDCLLIEVKHIAYLLAEEYSTKSSINYSLFSLLFMRGHVDSCSQQTESTETNLVRCRISIDFSNL